MIKGSRGWVKFLESKELPVLARTLKSILTVTGDDSASLSQLSDVVLRDADLTSGVIKLANTPVYNPSLSSITTVSRAVVQIGFENVQSIAISSALVDKLTKNSSRTRLMQCLVRAFTAAVHARYLAGDCKPELREEIFVAALLYNVGEAAFWASNHDQTNILDAVLDADSGDPLVHQRDVLGTNFKALSKGLIRSWKLGKLLQESIEKPGSSDAKLVYLGVRISRLQTLSETDPNTKSCLEQVSEINSKPVSEILLELKENERRSAVLAERLGIKNAKNLLRSQQQEQAVENLDTAAILKCMATVSSLMTQGANLSQTAETILSCVQSALGMDRAGFYMAKPGTDTYYLTGSKNTPNNQDMLKPLMRLDAMHPLTKAFAPMRLPNAATMQIERAFVSDNASPQAKNNTVFCAFGPVFRQQRLCGFMYADIAGKSSLSQAHLDNFQMLLQQLQFSMAVSSGA